MRRILFIVATVIAVTLGGTSADYAQEDLDCDGLDDTTGEPMGRASGVCGGVYG